MFSNSLHIPVVGTRNEQEKAEDLEKFEEVMADHGLLNTFRQYIFTQSELSEQTLDPYY